jgi:hypothetical protein
MKVRLFIFLCLFGCAAALSSLFAQAFEVSPYAGYYWSSDNTGVGEFRGSPMFGVHGGGYITPTIEIGGHYSWSNHFQPSSSNVAATFAGQLGFPQGAVRSHLWEGEFTYNFAKRKMFGAVVKPYIALSAGALTASVRHGDTFVLNVRSIVTPMRTEFVPNDVLQSGDTFFTFSYGGGVKALRLWGPMGLFGDLRGRTLPNVFGHSTIRPELSAGLNLSWGER